jgi:hypothetical protein
MDVDYVVKAADLFGKPEAALVGWPLALLTKGRWIWSGS